MTGFALIIVKVEELLREVYLSLGNNRNKKITFHRKQSLVYNNDFLGHTVDNAR